MSLTTMSHPLTRFTVHIVHAFHLWECSDMHCREGMVKVQAAFWRDLMRPFEHKVDPWKEKLFKKHAFLNECS